MENKAFELSAGDITALSRNDSVYLNNKGASLYRSENFSDAVEYYRLAAAMGNVQSISNLGYCYLYGRSIEQNVSAAMGYFIVAASRGNADAAYKLGDIYDSDKWGMSDKELAVYYYRAAVSNIIHAEWTEDYPVKWDVELQNYPSLCYALGRHLLSGEFMCRNVCSAYCFLKHAEEGYKTEIGDGCAFYEKQYRGVLELIDDSQFDEYKAADDTDDVDIID